MRGGSDLSGGDDLCEGVVEDGLVSDQVEEVDAVHVEGQDVLTALQRIIITPHLPREIIIKPFCNFVKTLLSHRKEA